MFGGTRASAPSARRGLCPSPWPTTASDGLEADEGLSERAMSEVSPSLKATNIPLGVSMRRNAPSADRDRGAPPRNHNCSDAAWERAPCLDSTYMKKRVPETATTTIDASGGGGASVSVTVSPREDGGFTVSTDGGRRGPLLVASVPASQRRDQMQEISVVPHLLQRTVFKEAIEEKRPCHLLQEFDRIAAEQNVDLRTAIQSTCGVLEGMMQDAERDSPYLRQRRHPHGPEGPGTRPWRELSWLVPAVDAALISCSCGSLDAKSCGLEEPEQFGADGTGAGDKRGESSPFFEESSWKLGKRDLSPTSMLLEGRSWPSVEDAFLPKKDFPSQQRGAAAAAATAGGGAAATATAGGGASRVDQHQHQHCHVASPAAASALSKRLGRGEQETHWQEVGSSPDLRPIRSIGQQLPHSHHSHQVGGSHHHLQHPHNLGGGSSSSGGSIGLTWRNHTRPISIDPSPRPRSPSPTSPNDDTRPSPATRAAAPAAAPAPVPTLALSALPGARGRTSSSSSSVPRSAAKSMGSLLAGSSSPAARRSTPMPTPTPAPGASVAPAAALPRHASPSPSSTLAGRGVGDSAEGVGLAGGRESPSLPNLRPEAARVGSLAAASSSRSPPKLNGGNDLAATFAPFNLSDPAREATGARPGSSSSMAGPSPQSRLSRSAASQSESRVGHVVPHTGAPSLSQQQQQHQQQQQLVPQISVQSPAPSRPDSKTGTSMVVEQPPTVSQPYQHHHHQQHASPQQQHHQHQHHQHHQQQQQQQQQHHQHQQHSTTSPSQPSPRQPHAVQKGPNNDVPAKLGTREGPNFMSSEQGRPAFGSVSSDFMYSAEEQGQIMSSRSGLEGPLGPSRSSRNPASNAGSRPPHLAHSLSQHSNSRPSRSTNEPFREGEKSAPTFLVPLPATPGSPNPNRDPNAAATAPPLGLLFETTGQGLSIVGIEQAGLIVDHNKKAEASEGSLQAVRIGDVLVSVNGQSGSGRTLVSQIVAHSGQEMVLRFQRGEQQRELPEASRGGLVEAIFRILSEGTQHVNSFALCSFARLQGFRGDEHDWAQRYRAMLQRYQWEASKGPTLEQFRIYVDDSAAGSYCSDSELRAMLRELRQSPPPPSAPRYELIASLFKVLNVSQTSYLSARELQVYAHVTGFRGSDREWLKQYHALARRYGWQATRGEPNLTQFRAFLDDEAAGSAYCKDSDLARYLDHLTKTPPRLATREELKKKLFKALDYSSANRLMGDDLRRFAELCGFDCGPEAWNSQYVAMCKSFKWVPEEGVDEAGFGQLVDAGGCTNCTNDELFEMAARLEKRPISPISRGRSASNMDDGRDSSSSPPMPMRDLAVKQSQQQQQQSSQPSPQVVAPRPLPEMAAAASPTASAALGAQGKAPSASPPLPGVAASTASGSGMQSPNPNPAAMGLTQSRPSQPRSPRAQSPRGQSPLSQSPRESNLSPRNGDGVPECPMPPGERIPSDRPLPVTTSAELSLQAESSPAAASQDKSTLPMPSSNHYPGPPFLPPPSGPSSASASPFVGAATARPPARSMNSTMSPTEEHADLVPSTGASPVAEPSSPRARTESGVSGATSPVSLPLKGKGKGKGKPGMKGKPGASPTAGEDGSPRAGALTAPMEYIVVLEKVPGTSLGLNIGSTKEGNLLIESVRDGCSVQARNLVAAKNGEEQILPGDEIISVNGTTAGKPGSEGAKPLLDAMRRADGKFELVLRRQRRSVGQLSGKATSPRSTQGVSPGRSLGQHQSQTVSTLGPSVSQQDLAQATTGTAVSAATPTPASAPAPSPGPAGATTSTSAASGAAGQEDKAPDATTGKAGPMAFMARLKRKLR